MTPPHIPALTMAADTANFSKEFTDTKVQERWGREDNEDAVKIYAGGGGAGGSLDEAPMSQSSKGSRNGAVVSVDGVELDVDWEEDRSPFGDFAWSRGGGCGHHSFWDGDAVRANQASVWCS
jgi:hypothetical protein